MSFEILIDLQKPALFAHLFVFLLLPPNNLYPHLSVYIFLLFTVRALLCFAVPKIQIIFHILNKYGLKHKKIPPSVQKMGLAYDKKWVYRNKSTGGWLKLALQSIKVTTAKATKAITINT